MRAVLILISIKRPQICKIYFHYECMMMLLDQSMPRDIGIDTVSYILLLVTGINFFSFYYDFWVCLFTACIQRILFALIRSQIFMEDLDFKAVIDTLISFVWILVTLSICHITISAAGFLFVEAEILRKGDEELLDSLDVGLIIVDKDDNNEVIFLNESAKKF